MSRSRRSVTTIRRATNTTPPVTMRPNEALPWFGTVGMDGIYRAAPSYDPFPTQVALFRDYQRAGVKTEQHTVYKIY